MLDTLKKISGTETAPLGHRLTVRTTGPLGAPSWCHFPKAHCFPIHFLYKNRVTLNFVDGPLLVANQPTAQNDQMIAVLQSSCKAHLYMTVYWILTM